MYKLPGGTEKVGGPGAQRSWLASIASGMGVSGGGSVRTRCCPLVGTAVDSGERGIMGKSGLNPLLLSRYVKLCDCFVLPVPVGLTRIHRA